MSQILNRHPKHKQTDKAAIKAIVQMAMNVELFTIPLYMSSMYSIKGFHQVNFGNHFDGYRGRHWPGIEPSAHPTTANEKAFNSLFGIFIQEMFHLEMTANIASAIGVQPCFTDAALQTREHGWHCYGPNQTEIPGIVDLKDTVNHAHLKIDLGPINRETLNLMMAIEQPEEQAKSNIRTDAKEKYFPTVPFEGWQSCQPLPLFGSIGHMYECLLQYACIKYNNDPANPSDNGKTLFQILYEDASPTMIQRTQFNASYLPAEFPKVPNTFFQHDQATGHPIPNTPIGLNDVHDRLKDMIHAIVDQGEGHSFEPISQIFNGSQECTDIYSTDFVIRMIFDYLWYIYLGICQTHPCHDSDEQCCNILGIGGSFFMMLRDRAYTQTGTQKSEHIVKSIQEILEKEISQLETFAQKNEKSIQKRVDIYRSSYEEAAQKAKKSIQDKKDDDLQTLDESYKLLDSKGILDTLYNLRKEFNDETLNKALKLSDTQEWDSFVKASPMILKLGKTYLLMHMYATLCGHSFNLRSSYDACCWEDFVYVYHHPSKPAMHARYKSFNACGELEPESADAEARCDYAMHSHYDRLKQIKEELLCDIVTWKDWHDEGNCWEGHMLETGEICTTPHIERIDTCGNDMLPSTDTIASAMNELKSLRHTPSDQFLDMQRIAVGAIYGIVQTLREFWNDENYGLSMGAMRSSHGRISILWAVYGENINLNLDIGNPDRLSKLHNACQGLSFDSPGNVCASAAAYHTCAGANSCRAQGACGTVKKDHDTLVSEPLLDDNNYAPSPAHYSPPSDNQCKSLGGCAVPISASQLLRVNGEVLQNNTYLMRLYNFDETNNNRPLLMPNPNTQMTFKQGDLVYDKAWEAYTKVMAERGKDPGIKPEPDLIRLVLAPV